MDKDFANMVKDAFKLAAKIVNNAPDAHDVIQDAATIAISHSGAPKFSDKAFKPWFYKVVRNKAIDKIRSSQRELNRHDQASSENIEEHVDTNKTMQDPETQLLERQRQNNLNAALATISIEHREIILLKDYHDFSYLQIAEILGIAKGAVMSRLHRARMALKNALLTPSKEDAHNDS
jgi:RNA polymerase sigma-70 factor (ECF subfamily)